MAHKTILGGSIDAYCRRRLLAFDNQCLGNRIIARWRGVVSSVALIFKREMVVAEDCAFFNCLSCS